MACRELFSHLPRSTASDTAAGATATVSEAKPTSHGCQALRCTPATLRVCDWVVGAGGGGGGEGRSQAGSCIEWQLDSATFPESTIFFLVEPFISECERFQSFSIYTQAVVSQINAFILLFTELLQFIFPCFSPDLQSVCSALWGLCESHLSCRAGDACRGCCVSPALLHLQRLFLPPADRRPLRLQGGTATVFQRRLSPVCRQPELLWHR